jgi:hypothetical protein
MLLLERASAEAVSFLRGAGVRSILVKGPLQQAWLSAAGPPRASVDIDLLVDPGDMDAARRALHAAGYGLEPEVTPGVEHHGDRFAAPGRYPVEVHWTLSAANSERTWEVVERHTEHVTLAGVTVEIPDEPARCLIVALHAAQHGPDVWETLHDLDRATVVATRESWSQAAELAGAVGADEAFVGGLSLTEAGTRLRDDLGLEPQPLTELQALTVVGDVEGAPGFHWLAQTKGVRAKTAFVARKIFPPADFMRFKHPFARRGPAFLAVVYAYRPLWMARWALPGLLAWRRSRRAVQASRRL